MKPWLALAVVCVPRLIQAGTADRLGWAAFNDDGTRFAFTVVGTEDGSGFPYTRLRIFEVKSNAHTKSEDSFGKGGTSEEMVLKALERDRSELLAPFRSPGDPGTEMYTNGTKTKTSFVAGGKKVEVSLRLTPVQTDNLPGEWGTFYSVVLVVKVDGRTRTVDPQLNVPNVNLLSVLLAKNQTSLAVLIKHDEPPGFEGLDRRIVGITVSLAP